MPKKGMDICYHQGEIDFNKVKADGIDFVIPRDGWGIDYIDPKLVQYTKDALEAGIEVPGVYHFIYGINTEEAIKNAQRAIANVQAARLPNTTVIWCDLEYDTIDNARDYRNTNLTNAGIRQMAESFCNYILAEGYPTGIYLNKDFVNRYSKDILDEYDIWLADLEGEADYPCVYRQTDWYAKINGISTNVDVDEYYGQYTTGTAKPKGDKKEVIEVTVNSNLSTFIAALPNIKKGSSGEVVKVLQKALKKLGYYSGDIDGNAGNLTDAAIKAIQKDWNKVNGLGIDGVFGQKSWTLLLKNQ